MSDLEYEHNNKEILEVCCQVMHKSAAEYTYKSTKLEVRRRIEQIKDRKELIDIIEL